MPVEEAVKEVLKDEVFYRSSGGGLTLGGGEPLAQAEFAAALLEAVRSRGISTAVETAGNVPWENFRLVYPHTDYFLFDIKHTDTEKHKLFTGADTSLIQENLKRLSGVHSGVIARVPVIPGFNCSEEELLEIAGSAAKAGLREINFLPYHGYGSGKYSLLGKEYLMKNTRPLPGTCNDSFQHTAEITGLLLKLKPAIEALGLKVQIGG
jgi:pyruvate formate lyase activating enzyme